MTHQPKAKPLAAAMIALLTWQSTVAPVFAAGPKQEPASAQSNTTFSSLRAAASGPLTVSIAETSDTVRFLRAPMNTDLHASFRGSADATAKARSFLDAHGVSFGLRSAAEELQLDDVRVDAMGKTRVSFRQHYKGVPVFGAMLRSHVDQDGRLTAVNGVAVPVSNLNTQASVTAKQAGAIAIEKVSVGLPSAQKQTAVSVRASELTVFQAGLLKGVPGLVHLAWNVEVGSGNSIREFVFIDAHSGKVLDKITGIQRVKTRSAYEANFDPANPGTPPPAWAEGDARPAASPSHEDEIAGAGHSYNLFYNLSNGTYRSWDGTDGLQITVNNDPGITCPNANWNGTSTNYCTGTSADDVVAHEWGHAYTQATSGLIYQWQSGALNESYSDIFGESLDLLNNREMIGGNPTTALGTTNNRIDDSCSEFMSQLPEDDDSIRWLMGEDAFAFAPLPPVGDAAIRDMWNPSCAGDPGHTDSVNYHCSASDVGGVHTNSAVTNRAYALMVDGGTVNLKDDGSAFGAPVTVNGIGMTKALHIQWRANSVYNTPSSNFQGNADALEQSCQDLIGAPLTKPVTTAELLTPFPLTEGNDDTIDPTLEISTDVITALDCVEVDAAIRAVEMRRSVVEQCGFVRMLNPEPAPMCGGAASTTYFMEDWDAGMPATWTTGQAGVSKPVLDTLEFYHRTDLPKNVNGSTRSGGAVFQENRVDLGNCSTDDESGQLWMDSPAITVPSAGPGIMVFDHYVATETGFDGGNVKISINGGGFTIIPGTAFTYNGYNMDLMGTVDQNTNPIGGQESYTGGNGGEVSGSWGQSQIDLAAAGASAGDSIVIRFDFGQDGCNGNDGWYVDTVQLLTCDGPPPPSGNGEVCLDVAATVTQGVIEAGLPVLSSATVSGAGTSTEDINVADLMGSHTYMGDLTMTLQSPAGTSVVLFDGTACAGETGFSATLNDEAATTIGYNDWTSGGTFKAQNALSAFDGEDPNGKWNLTISDGFPLDNGALDGWTLQVCEIDGDLDNVPDNSDNCPLTANADQADGDGDGVGDACDNCTAVDNPGQCDTNGDGYGNHCDADLNNNGVVNFVDLGMLKSVWETADADADLNCNGVVNFVDLGILKSSFLGFPGPSALVP